MADGSLRVLALAALVVLAGLTAGCRKPPQPAESAASATPAAAVPPSASDAAAVEAFVKGFYAPGAMPMQTPEQTFDAPMLALMAEDARVTPKGDVGALDGDPFCDCQDSEGMTAQVAVIEVKPDAATAVATLTWGGQGAPRTDRITYDLVKVKGAWRIHDISAKDLPSLRQLYITSNAEAAHRKP